MAETWCQGRFNIQNKRRVDCGAEVMGERLCVTEDSVSELCVVKDVESNREFDALIFY